MDLRLIALNYLRGLVLGRLYCVDTGWDIAIRIVWDDQLCIAEDL